MPATILTDIRPQPVPKNITLGQLLGRSGVYDVNQIVPLLAVPGHALKAAAAEISATGGNPWQSIGVVYDPHRKIWLLHMETFAAVYFDRFVPQIRSVEPEWDGNDLLARKEKFYLADVCQKLPFTPQQLRYQYSMREESGREEIGIMKENGTYVVDMPRFRKWMEQIWRNATGWTSPEIPTTGGQK